MKKPTQIDEIIWIAKNMTIDKDKWMKIKAVADGTIADKILSEDKGLLKKLAE